jgi:deazaflavin-dependent oxidoreductase (nitroreductase family)
MTAISPTLERQLRQTFKRINPLMLLLWRLGLGRWVNCWPAVGGRILVLAHTGRRTGRRRLTPLNYAVVDGQLYVTAGFGAAADWYRNLQARPAIEAWLPEGWWAGTAEEVTDPAQRLPLMRQVLIGSGIVGPLFGLNPRTLDDEALARATAEYRVIRLRRTAARTGEGGPGDLAWVWVAATAVLLLRLGRRGRR